MCGNSSKKIGVSINNEFRKLTKHEKKRFHAEVSRLKKRALKLEKSNGGDHAKEKQ